MKMLLLTLACLVTVAAHTQQFRNPYYRHIEPLAKNFVATLSHDDYKDFFALFLASKAPQGKSMWMVHFKDMFDTILTRFFNAFEKTQKTMQLAKDPEQYLDEFGVYALLALYRVAYLHAGNNNYVDHTLPTPEMYEDNCIQRLAHRVQ